MVFSMLFIVLASAGPGVPGDGDVFLMGPTMAYGAVPHTLLSAPDGGSGFDLGCWSSTKTKEFILARHTRRGARRSDQCGVSRAVAKRVANCKYNPGGVVSQ